MDKTTKDKEREPCHDSLTAQSCRDRLRALNELLVESGNSARIYREQLEEARAELDRMNHDYFWRIYSRFRRSVGACPFAALRKALSWVLRLRREWPLFI